jgi:hypothetical protein
MRIAAQAALGTSYANLFLEEIAHAGLPPVYGSCRFPLTAIGGCCLTTKGRRKTYVSWEPCLESTPMLWFEVDQPNVG